MDPQAAGLDPSAMPPEMLQAYLSSMQAAPGPSDSQDPSTMQLPGQMPDGMPGPASYQALAAWAASNGQDPQWAAPVSETQAAGLTPGGQALLDAAAASQWGAGSSGTQSAEGQGALPEQHDAQGPQQHAAGSSDQQLPGQAYLEQNAQNPQHLPSGTQHDGSGDQIIALQGPSSYAAAAPSGAQLDQLNMPGAVHQGADAHAPLSGNAHVGGTTGTAHSSAYAAAAASAAPAASGAAAHGSLSIDQLDMDVPSHLWDLVRAGHLQSGPMGALPGPQTALPSATEPQYSAPQYASQGVQEATYDEEARANQSDLQQQVQVPTGLQEGNQGPNAQSGAVPGRPLVPIPFRGPLQGLTLDRPNAPSAAVQPAAMAADAAGPTAPTGRLVSEGTAGEQGHAQEGAASLADPAAAAQSAANLPAQTIIAHPVTAPPSMPQVDVVLPEDVADQAFSGQAISASANPTGLQSMPMTAGAVSQSGNGLIAHSTVLQGQVMDGSLPLELAVLHGAVISNGEVATSGPAIGGMEPETATLLGSIVANERAGQMDGQAHSSHLVTGINPFTGQPYTYIPSK